MASLAIAAAGAALGAGGASFFGASLSLGASLGWAAGSMLGSVLFAPKSPTIYGPRIADHRVQSSAFGDPIPEVWANKRVSCELIWSSELKEHARKKKGGGKGGGRQTSVSYSYTVDFAVAICDTTITGPIAGVRKMWAGPKLIYDIADNAPLDGIIASGAIAKSITFYPGNETQLPDPLMESYLGVGHVPAGRGQARLVFEDFDLTRLNFASVPPMSVEVVMDGTSIFKEVGLIDLEKLVTPAGAGENFAFAFVDELGEVQTAAWDFDLRIGSQNWYSDPMVFGVRGGPWGSAVDTNKVPISVVFNQILDNSDANPKGKSDEHGYCVNLLMASPTIYGTAYCSISQNRSYLLLNPRTAGIDGHEADNWAKKDDEILISHKGAAADHYLVIYDLAVAQLRRLRDFDSGVEGAIFDTGLAEDYAYVALNPPSSPTTNHLLRLDKLDLSTIATFDPGVNFQAMHVESDSLIYLWVHTTATGISAIYKVENFATVTLVGQCSTSINFATNIWQTLFHRNGLFYVQESQAGIQHGSTNILILGFVSTSNCISLSVIVTDICERSGLAASRINVSELTDLVCGYDRLRRKTGREMIANELMPAYGFRAVQSDGKLKFPKLGKATVASITDGELAAHEFGSETPDPISRKRGQETELPRLINVLYSNPAADYQRGMQPAGRLITSGRRNVDVDLTALRLSDSEARKIADRLLMQTWMERTQSEIRLNNKYAWLDPIDSVNVEVEK